MRAGTRSWIELRTALPIALCLACQTKQPGNGAKEVAASVSVESRSPPVPKPEDLKRFEGLASWTMARQGDDIDRARLAESAGGLGLWRGVEVGGWVRQVALRSLPLAPDAEVVLVLLCAELPRAGKEAASEDAQLVLGATLGVVSRPPRQGEHLDADAYTRCREPLHKLAEAGEPVPRRVSDLASAALASIQARPR